jgi:hypothetical protein
MMHHSGSALGENLGATERAQTATAGKGFDALVVHKSQLHGAVFSLRALTPELNGGGPLSEKSTEAQSRRPLE